MQTHLETFTTPDGRSTITIEVDFVKKTVNWFIEENEVDEIDNVSQIFE